MIIITKDNFRIIEDIFNNLYGGIKKDDNDAYVLYVVTKKMHLLEITIYSMEDCNHVMKYYNIYDFFVAKKLNPEPFYYIYKDGPANFWFK